MSTKDPRPAPAHNPTPNPDDWQKGLPGELMQPVVICTDPNRRPHDRRVTSKGTPCAPSWDDDWIAKVEAAEQRLDRRHGCGRICGSATSIPMYLVNASRTGAATLPGDTLT